MSKRFWLEYTGSWAKQCWHYDGQATQFLQMSDGRQVGDAGREEVYRYILATEDAVVPFVPKKDSDWAEIERLNAEMEKEREIVLAEERAASARAVVAESKAKALAVMANADKLELESQRLRASVQELESVFAKQREDLKAAEKVVADLRGETPKEAEPPKPKPARKKRPSAKKKE